MRRARRRAGLASAACGLLLLAGCAEGIRPTSELPVQVGPPPPFPNIAPSPAPDEAQTLTPSELAAMQAQLNRLASEREADVRKRIERSK